MNNATRTALPADLWDVVEASAAGARQLRAVGRTDEADSITDAALWTVAVACGRSAPWAS